MPLSSICMRGVAHVGSPPYLCNTQQEVLEVLPNALLHHDKRCLPAFHRTSERSSVKLSLLVSLIALEDVEDLPWSATHILRP